MNKLRFSVVVCTLNRFFDLNKCMESLSRQIKLPYETIIVDASDNKKTMAVAEHWRNQGRLSVIYIHSTPGLTKQRNLGISHSKGDIIVFLDDDVILDEHYFQAMSLCFESSKDIAGATGNITNLKTLTRASIYFRKIFMLSGRAPIGVMKRSGFPDFVDPNRARNMVSIQVLSGCNMLYRKEVFDTYMFDEIFEGYSLGEDAEFSHRVSKRHRLVYVKNAQLVHVVSNDQRVNYQKYFEMAIFNHFYIFKKNVKRSALDWIFFYWSVVGITFFSFYLSLAENNLKALKGLLSGYGKILC